MKTKKTAVIKRAKSALASDSPTTPTLYPGASSSSSSSSSAALVFNESFTFTVDASNVDTYSVSIHVMENHMTNKDKQLGRVVLGSFMYARGRELEHWNEMIAKPKEQISLWHRLLQG